MLSVIGESPGKSKKRKLGSTNDAVEVIVAARQDNILCTAFHPELTEDPRWHVYFTRLTAKFVDEQKSR